MINNILAVGCIAFDLADTILVTDDNPRTENPAAIRRDVIKGCPEALEIPNREEAIQRLQRSLNEFVIEGITTTIELHKKILGHKKFINSDFDVNWLAKENFY